MRRYKATMIFYTTVWLLLFLASNVVMVISHEILHENIYKDYGCKDIRVQVGIFGSTSCVDPDYVETWEASDMHQMVDIVGYPLHVLLIGVMGVVHILTLALIWVTRHNEEAQE